MSENDPTLTVQTKLGKTRLAIQVSILAFVTFIGGYVMLGSDRHNDGRYVTQADYQKDRDNDERIRQEVSRGISWRMDQTDAKLKEISDDIKTLLRQQRQP